MAYSQDIFLELRRELTQVNDQLGLANDTIRVLRSRLAKQLEALGKQAVLLAELAEYIDGRDIVRTPEIRAILEAMRE